MSDNSKNNYSDDELDEILKDYSNIGRQRTPSKPQSDLNAAESKNPYVDTESSSGKPAPVKKKFVVHIDESIMDNDNSSPDNSSHSNNTGGIYFSNYSRNRSKTSSQPKYGANRVETQHTRNKASRPNSGFSAVISDTRASVKNKVETIGGRAAAGFLAFIIISTAVLSYIGLTCVGDMLAINRSEENVEVLIPPNSTHGEIIDILKDNDLIKRKLFCKLFTTFRGFNDEEYLSGNYYLNSKMGVEGMLKDLMAAPVTADTITLSFPEGWTLQQIFEKLEKYDVCDSNRLYSGAKSTSFDSTYKFMADITKTENRYLKLEGYMFPDTYDFYVDADTNYVIKKFLDNFEARWEDEYDARAQKLGYTRDEIVIIASIIQKEAADSDQMKTISSILHNRLKDQANFPTLGCDSTAIYISNYVTPVVGEAQGRLLYDNYDTSAVRGLPPGPICNPGMDAIRAALYPSETNYYFFAHDKSGRIYLAKTLNEHRNNLVKIIQANNR